MSNPPTKTNFWHPFAPMGAVDGHEFVIERADDVWVWDTDGNRYLDGTASLWYSNIGHGRSEMADAIHDQMEKMEAYSAFGDLANPTVLQLCDRLVDLSEGRMGEAKVFLGAGGGDAIDTAAKLARRFWQLSGEPERVHLLSRTQGYHGTHGFGTAIAGIEPNREGLGPLMEETARAAHHDIQALEAEIERLGPETVAAFFCEPVIGAGGVHPPSEGYIEAIGEICKRHGILLVIDSVICGFGRLGTWFGFERWDIEPDMVTFAKGVTSGYLPLGGVLINQSLTGPFWDDPSDPPFRHGQTYAGHSTCCAAALKNIEIMEREGLLEKVLENEKIFFDAFSALDGHDAVGEVRGGVGLLAAVGLHPDLLAERPSAPVELGKLVRDRGVLVRPLGDGVAASPPLTAELEHFGEISSAIAAGLEEL
jgi:adenosylmethionine-8-amino-7-oxononanoate aminotransferase